MKLKPREITLLAVVVLLCGAAVFAIFRRGPAEEQNFPGGTWWMCTNDGCKNEFNLSIEQIAEHHEKHYGEPITCPKCKSKAVRASKCPSCGKVSVQRLDVLKCPHCGKQLDQ
jgi:hypothetical protein